MRGYHHYSARCIAQTVHPCDSATRKPDRNRDMDSKFHGIIGTVIRTTLLCAAIPFGASQSQAYPDKPITIIVNSEAGGPTDLTARVLKEDLQTILGKPIVVENRLGAGGIVGAGIVAKANPDRKSVV